jgi:hypothetical protein
MKRENTRHPPHVSLSNVFPSDISEPCMHLCSGAIGNADQLLTSFGALGDGEARRAAAEEGGKEAQAGIIGRPVNRGGSQLQLQGIAMQPCHRIARGPWLHANGEQDISARLPDVKHRFPPE